MRTALVFLSLVAVITHQVRAESFAYVSLSGEERIALYSVAASTGKWTPRGHVRHAGLPGSLASSPSGSFLFAAIRGKGQLASFRRDSKTGQLTHLNTVSGGADPAFVTVDKSGKYLLTAYYVAAKVTVHRIQKDGRISTRPLQTIETADKSARHSARSDQPVGVCSAHRSECHLSILLRSGSR